MRRYLIDYVEGRFQVYWDDTEEGFEERSKHYASLTLTDEEVARLERHLEEERYWQRRFMECDNEWYRSNSEW